MDARIKAIRDDKKVGSGTCSTIDECYTDAELLDSLGRSNVVTPRAAVRWARLTEGLHDEMESNTRWE